MNIEVIVISTLLAAAFVILLLTLIIYFVFLYIEKTRRYDSVYKTESEVEVDFNTKTIKFTRYEELDHNNGIKKYPSYTLTIEEFMKEYTFKKNDIDSKNMLDMISKGNTLSEQAIKKITGKNISAYNRYTSKEKGIKELNKYCVFYLGNFNPKTRTISGTVIEYHSKRDLTWTIITDDKKISEIDALKLLEKLAAKRSKAKDFILFTFEPIDRMKSHREALALEKDLLLAVSIKINQEKNFYTYTTKQNKIIGIYYNPETSSSEMITNQKAHDLILEKMNAYIEELTGISTKHQNDYVLATFFQKGNVNIAKPVEQSYVSLMVVLDLKEKNVNINNELIYNEVKIIAANILGKSHELIRKIKRKQFPFEVRKVKTQEGHEFIETFLTIDNEDKYYLVDYALIAKEQIVLTYIDFVNKVSRMKKYQNKQILMNLHYSFASMFEKYFHTINKRVIIEFVFDDKFKNDWMLPESMVEELRIIKKKHDHHIGILVSDTRRIIDEAQKILLPDYIFFTKEFKDSIYGIQENEIFEDEILQNASYNYAKVYNLLN